MLRVRAYVVSCKLLVENSRNYKLYCDENFEMEIGDKLLMAGLEFGDPPADVACGGGWCGDGSAGGVMDFLWTPRWFVYCACFYKLAVTLPTMFLIMSAELIHPNVSDRHA
jgi:hypothetical protein